MKKFLTGLLSGVLMLTASAVSINNGDFAKTQGAYGNVTKDVGFGVWSFGNVKRMPSGWILNPAYPGVLEVGKEDAVTFLKVAGTVDQKHKRGAHLYSAVTDMEAGKSYRLSARIRNGALSIGFYEYHTDKTMRAVTVISGKNEGGEWQEISGIYTAPANFRNAYAALMVPFDGSVEISGVKIEEATAEEAEAAAAEFNNGSCLLKLGSDARLKSFKLLKSGKEYAGVNALDSIALLKVNGKSTRANALKLENGMVKLSFPEPEFGADLKITPRKGFFEVEVVSVKAPGAEQFSLEFPLVKLSTKSTISSANFDDEFVGNCFALDFLGFCTVRPGDNGTMTIAADFEKKFGFDGGKIALTGIEKDKFYEVAKTIEAQYHLPSPRYNGQWLRESEALRRSYLMVMDMEPGDLKKLIAYAKLGKFETIVFCKDIWLATHGHYEINTKYFPGGKKEFQAACKQIHDAGLKAGVHIFGPSISCNDAYVTPVPDARLASVPCPPLEQGISATDTELVFAKRPASLTPQGFPETHLQIGNEIIKYGKVEGDAPCKLSKLERGVYGTKAAAHPAGAPVKGLITKLDFFMLVPETPLLNEVAGHFAKVVNDCGIDMVYVDASDCEIQAKPMGYDLRRYVDHCHYTFYRKFDHDVLYQTSTGLGFNLMWHIVARGASANGFGDIKKLLAARMRILQYSAHFAHADVGWYGLDPAIRLNAIEYIAAKCLACDGSISIQGSCRSWEFHPQGREIFEMLSRYEECRVSRALPGKVTDLLLERDKDFRLYGSSAEGWKLYEATFCDDRSIRSAADSQKSWEIENPYGDGASYALEILRYPVYTTSDTVILEDFTSPGAYSVKNASKGVRSNLGHVTYPLYYGNFTGAWQVLNDETARGSVTLGKTYASPLDLSASRHIALWVYGDGSSSPVTLSLADKAGKKMDFNLVMGFSGWRLLYFDIPKSAHVQLKEISALTLTMTQVPGKGRVYYRFAGIKALPGVEPDAMHDMKLLINGQALTLPGKLKAGESLTLAPDGTATVWPGKMLSGKKEHVSAPLPVLKAGKNQLRLQHAGGGGAIVRIIPLKRVY